MKQIDHLLCFSLLYIVLVKVSQVKAVPYRLPSRFWLLLLLIPVTLFIYLSIFRLCHRDSDTFEASLTSGSVQNLNKTDSKSSILSRISGWSKTLFGEKSTAPEEDLFKCNEKYGTSI